MTDSLQDQQEAILAKFCRETGVSPVQAGAFAAAMVNLAMKYVIEQPLTKAELLNALAVLEHGDDKRDG